MTEQPWEIKSYHIQHDVGLEDCNRQSSVLTWIHCKKWLKRGNRMAYKTGAGASLQKTNKQKTGVGHDEGMVMYDDEDTPSSFDSPCICQCCFHTNGVHCLINTLSQSPLHISVTCISYIQCVNVVQCYQTNDNCKCQLN